MYSTHHGDSSSATESQDAASEAAGPSSQRQDPVERMPPWAKWYGKGKYVPAVWSHHQRQGRNHGDQQVHTAEIGVQRGEAHPCQKVEGRTELDLVQDEVDEARRLLEEAHVEVQAAQNKVTEAAFRDAAFRVRQAMEEMAQIRTLLGVNPEPTDQ